MGELNFCLGPSDSVLSGPSLLKDLNTATNKLVKNMLILNSPGQFARSTLESTRPNTARLTTHTRRLRVTCAPHDQSIHVE